MISLEVVEKKKKDGDLGGVQPNYSAHPKYEDELAHSWNGKISVRFCYTMCYCLGRTHNSNNSSNSYFLHGMTFRQHLVVFEAAIKEM